jgi:Cu-Zn family superoxide dismutase
MQALRISLAAVLVLSGCSMYGAAGAERADVPMRDATGRDLGTLTLANTTGGLMLSGALHGLPPGTHGIHLHTTGRCEPPFTTAGGHWNPMGRMHGTQNPQGPHLGDMPNIVVSSDGIAAVSVTTPGGTLLGTDALLDADGAAVVIHESADDYRTDPSGNSGARIACGVVRGS